MTWEDGDERVVELDFAGGHAAHPELGNRGCDHAGLVGGDKEQRLAGRGLRAVGGLGQQQQVVRDVGHRRPDLGPADQKAAVGRLCPGGHRAEQVGAAAWLGDRDRHLLLARDHLRDELVADLGTGELLNRLGAERRDTPHPGEAGQVAGQLVHQDRLHRWLRRPVRRALRRSRRRGSRRPPGPGSTPRGSSTVMVLGALELVALGLRVLVVDPVAHGASEVLFLV